MRRLRWLKIFLYREVEVLQVVADSPALKVAAPKLGIAEGTLDRHLRRACSKLGVQSTIQAVAEGFRLGLLK